MLCATAAAAWPALHARAITGGGLMLLAGLSGFCLLSVLALLAPGGAVRPARASTGEAASAVVEALDEPSAVLADDGRVRAANPAWRELWGSGAERRLPRATGEGLYALLAGVRAQGGGEGEIATPPVAASPARRGWVPDILLRLAPLAAAKPEPRPAPAPVAPQLVVAAPTGFGVGAPAALDAFAAAAPFGAALLDGSDGSPRASSA